MRKGEIIGKIFGIAVVFVMIGAMLGGLPSAVSNAAASTDQIVYCFDPNGEDINMAQQGTLTANKTAAFDPGGEIPMANKSSTPPTIYSDCTLAPPTIDGLLSPSEWGSPTVTKTLNYFNCITDQYETHDMHVYFINDNTYLYVAIRITNEDFESEDIQKGDIDVIELYFDNDNDEVIEPNEDIKNFWNSKYRDWFYNPTEERPMQWSEDERTDGIGAASHSTHSEGDYSYEFKIPLDSGDIHDLAITANSIVGIKILYREMYYDATDEHWHWKGEDGWPTKEGRFNGATYGKLVLCPAEWDPWAYDENSDGVIQKSEAIQAVVDYFDGVITKEQAIEVVLLYFG